jgi:hypothetical protein
VFATGSRAEFGASARAWSFGATDLNALMPDPSLLND